MDVVPLTKAEVEEFKLHFPNHKPALQPGGPRPSRKEAEARLERERLSRTPKKVVVPDCRISDDGGATWWYAVRVRGREPSIISRPGDMPSPFRAIPFEEWLHQTTY